MGATNIDFELPATKKFSEVVEYFKTQRMLDAQRNGHQDGYSGDWQTVRAIKDHSHKTFTDYQTAYDYALDNAEKWEYGVAVMVTPPNAPHYWLVVAWAAC